MSTPQQLGRRAFLQQGTLILTAAGVSGAPLSALAADPAVAKTEAAGTRLKFGLLTDMHYADKPAAGTRYYRETLDKLAEAGQKFQQESPRFLVELGDLIDAADSVETELKWLRTIDRALQPLSQDRHYVLGNHCVDTLTKAEFLGAIEREQSYYSFDRDGWHFVVLDACFRSDGEPYQRKNFHWTDPNIPPAELEWLTGDLQETSLPVMVFAHQRLDATDNHAIKNSAAVRKILSDAGKVRAVFQGHSHKNFYQELGGVHYVTLRAMVEGSGAESNGYSMVTASADGTVQLTGYRDQKNYRMAHAKN
jgi:hypothetical protein